MCHHPWIFGGDEDDDRPVAVFFLLEGVIIGAGDVTGVTFGYQGAALYSPPLEVRSGDSDGAHASL